MRKIILDPCGGTGSWSRPYYDAGYDVRIITLPKNDIRNYIPPDNVYGVLFAPPCTEFSVSGGRWWKDKDPRLLEEALEVFDAGMKMIIKCNPHFWAIENPVGRLKRLRYEVLGEPRLIFHPYEYGDAYCKKTLLWGKFNIPIRNEVKPEYMVSKKGYKYSPIARWFPNREERQRVRSITPPGFAKAFYEANK